MGPLVQSRRIEVPPGHHIVARKTINLGDAGFRYPGQPVPEAAEWPNGESWVNQGRLDVVPVEEPKADKPKGRKG